MAPLSTHTVRQCARSCTEPEALEGPPAASRRPGGEVRAMMNELTGRNRWPNAGATIGAHCGTGANRECLHLRAHLPARLVPLLAAGAEGWRSACGPDDVATSRVDGLTC
jgi:hypothetical protein